MTHDDALVLIEAVNRGIVYMSIVDNVKRHSLERLASFVDAIVGKRLTYARLIAKVPA